jgi:hypothetical protein
MHVAPEDLTRYRRLVRLAHRLSSIGNIRSGRGDYTGANRAWRQEEQIVNEAQKLRVPGKDGK